MWMWIWYFYHLHLFQLIYILEVTRLIKTCLLKRCFDFHIETAPHSLIQMRLEPYPSMPAECWIAWSSSFLVLSGLHLSTSWWHSSLNTAYEKLCCIYHTNKLILTISNSATRSTVYGIITSLIHLFPMRIPRGSLGPGPDKYPPWQQTSDLLEEWHSLTKRASRCRVSFGCNVCTCVEICRLQREKILLLFSPPSVYARTVHTLSAQKSRANTGLACTFRLATHGPFEVQELTVKGVLSPTNPFRGSPSFECIFSAHHKALQSSSKCCHLRMSSATCMLFKRRYMDGFFSDYPPRSRPQ